MYKKLFNKTISIILIVCCLSTLVVCDKNKGTPFDGTYETFGYRYHMTIIDYWPEGATGSFNGFCDGFLKKVSTEKLTAS